MSEKGQVFLLLLIAILMFALVLLAASAIIDVLADPQAWREAAKDVVAFLEDLP